MHLALIFVDALQLAWRRCQEIAGSDHDTWINFSDHLFLFRKGVPFKQLGFDVNVEHIANLQEESDVIGRGYDAGIPAVFKAKVTLPAQATIFRSFLFQPPRRLMWIFCAASTC